MVGSILLNGCIGLIYCVVLLFCLGDLGALLESRTGFPFIQLFLNVTKSPAGATVLSLIPTLIACAANSAGLTSTSRTAWAFARDNAIPFSNYYTKVDNKFHVPTRMCVLISVLQALLGLIYIVNTTAFNAILSMAILGMYISYALPITFKIYNRFLAPSNVLPRAWFSLGRHGWIVDSLALLWSVVAIVFSVFPNAQPVTAQNMNYAVVVLAGWTLFGGVYFAVFKSRVYVGPLDFQSPGAAVA